MKSRFYLGGQLRATLVLTACLLPAQAAFVSFSDPNSTYLTGTNTISLASLSLASPVTVINTAALQVALSPSWQVADIGAAGFGEWTNFAGSSVESPLPARVLYQTNPAIYSLAFSGSTVRTFGFELAPYDGFEQDFTVTFFNGGSSVGSITRTVGFDLPAGTPTFYARLFAASSTIAFDRVDVTTTGSFGPVIAQMRWSDIALDQPVGQVPEPGSVVLLSAGLFVSALAVRNRRRNAA